MKRRTFVASTTAALTALQQNAQSQEPKYRVGILGTDNSHSGAFAKLINVDNAIPNARVVAMYGQEPERTQEMATKGQVKTIVENPEDMMDLVNVVFVVFRHGDLHKDFAMPFIEKGIPTFVDKPFALKTDDAYEMLYAAKEFNTYISSFSTVRWGSAVMELKANLVDGDPVITGGTAGPGSAESQYGGFGFYGIHAIELLTHTIADRVTHASAIREGNRVAGTVVTNSGKTFSIHIAEGLRGFRLFYCDKEGNHQIATGGDYHNGLQAFFDGLEHNKPPLSYEDMFEPVAMIEAMEQSMRQDGKRMEVKCFC